MKTSGKYQVWLPLLFGVVAAIGLLTGYQLAGSGAKWKDARTNRSGLQEVMDLLRYKYVDSLPLDSLEALGIEAILGNLDPHSVYIPAEELEEVNADLSGAFFGIGVEYQLINDTMNLVYVLEKGPGDVAGLQAGDQVVTVNDEPVAGIKIKADQLRKLIRGANKTAVQLGILRNGQPKSFAVTRGSILLPSVDASFMVAADIGYIRISKFAETTYKEFMDAATGLQKKGMKKLVLDLRGNGGGIMTEATNIADELLSDGLDLVSTRGNHTRSRTITSTKPGILEEAPLVVLIDEFSASASEVLAAALQDNDRGTIMGRRSFGKGLVQEQYDLSNGAALRLTVARYYTPIGRSIQKPYHGDVNDYYGEAVERHLKADTAQPSAADSSVYTTRKGRKLYGGGGIAPDIVIDADTTGRGSADSRLFDPVLINQFAFQLFKKYQTQVRSFPSPEKFNQGFALNGADWNALFEAARTDSNATSQVAEAAALPADLERRIKANMARLVWRNNGYFSIMQPGDRYLAAAIEHLSKP